MVERTDRVAPGIVLLEDERNGAFSAHAGHEKCIQNFVSKF